jgi:hypothetical protein
MKKVIIIKYMNLGDEPIMFSERSPETFLKLHSYFYFVSETS